MQWGAIQGERSGNLGIACVLINFDWLRLDKCVIYVSGHVNIM